MNPTEAPRLLNGFPVEHKRLDELTKAPWNPRTISDEQRAALKRSLAEFGTVEPIVVNRVTGHVVGGHQRLDALLALGETTTDVIVVELAAEKEKALNIALNQIRGDWNKKQLARLLEELVETGDAVLSGFDQNQIDRILDQTGGTSQPMYELTAELMEEHNYVLFYFDNTLDWQVVRESLGLKTVKSLKQDRFAGGGQAGIGRVVKGSVLLDLLKAAGLC